MGWSPKSEDEVLTRPWHYSLFNIEDGSKLKEPSQEILRVYSTEIKGHQIFVEAEWPEGRKIEDLRSKNLRHHDPHWGIQA
jgi:hypothetical protein